MQSLPLLLADLPHKEGITSVQLQRVNNLQQHMSDNPWKKSCSSSLGGINRESVSMIQKHTSKVDIFFN